MNSTILLIEDDEDIRENIVSILELAKYDVLSAGDGIAGVEIVQKQKPDLILCDIMMPELDGYGVLHILSKDISTVDIPFIFLTSKVEKEDIRAGMMLGADDYITKPFDGSELLNVIETRLKKHKLISDSFQNRINNFEDFFQNAKHLDEFKKFADHRPEKKLRKKDFLFLEGQHPIDLFYIKTGVLKTFKTSEDGKELVTGIHYGGTFVGYLSLLENTLYQESAVALEDTELQLIPKDDFHSLIYSNREVAGKFIKLLANNLADTEQRLMDMAYQSVRQRVAKELLKVWRSECHEDIEKPITTSRKNLAGTIGTAVESLNRTLSEFRDEGLVDLDAHVIRILDVKKLETIVK